VLEIRMLGPFEVIRDGQPISTREWRRRKTVTLLKVLLTERGRIFSDDSLVENIFGPDLEGSRSESTKGNLRGRVADLRHALEPGLESGQKSQFILRLGEGYCFSSQANVWLDVEAFRGCVADAEQAHERGQVDSAVELYESALKLFRGEFLETDPYEEWALASRERWHEERMSALIGLATCYAEFEDYKRAIGCLRVVLDAQPARESAIRKLMLLHYLAGEDSLATIVFERGKKSLKEYLNVAPSPETFALLREIQEGRMERRIDVLDKLRIAVLPFVNLCPDTEDEYFVDGVTEELIYSLSRFPELKVIAQTSILNYKDANKGIAQIGRELRVGTIVEGSVRKSNNELRVTAQLIDVASEEHLWAGEYDRELGDVFEIQTEISQDVSRHLRRHLTSEQGDRLEIRHAVDPEAYRLFLEGRYFLKRRYGDSLQRARASFESALLIDDAFARARASLASTLWLLVHFGLLPFRDGLAQAEREARAALALDESSGEAYGTLAAIRALAHYDLQGAAELHDRAVEAEPQNVEIRHHRAVNLLFLGELDAAIEAYQEALKIDPISSRLIRSLGYCLDFARRHNEAVAQLQRAERLEQRDWSLYMCFGNAYLHLQQYEKALEAYSLAAKIGDEAAVQETLGRILLAYVLGQMGEPAALPSAVAEAVESPEREADGVAVGYFLLGQDDLGFEWLDRARDEHASWYLYVLHEPLLDSISKDPRFREHLTRLGVRVR